MPIHIHFIHTMRIHPLLNNLSITPVYQIKPRLQLKFSTQMRPTKNPHRFHPVITNISVILSSVSIAIEYLFVIQA